MRSRWLGLGVALSLIVNGERVARAGALDREDDRLTLDLGLEISLQFIHIHAGRFVMGSGLVGVTAEGAMREVVISRAFWMGVTPITQGQWVAVMGGNPSRFSGGRCPVEGVAWEEAQAFCAGVGRITGRTVRLPTEAEWEFACRAGSVTDYCFGNEAEKLADYAWYGENSQGTTHPVGGKRPNAWGLHDMHGNVWEWCQDWYAPGFPCNQPVVDPKGPSVSAAGAHVLRGGAWHVEAPYCRSASRGGDFPCGEGGPGSWGDAGRAGLRVVVEIPGR